MAGEAKGWISLYRSIQDHWLWQEKPFDKAKAWLDLLLSANHQENKFLLGNELVAISKGSFITSQRKLMDRWGWGASKTRDFLKLLECEKMIKFEADKKKTLITIINYEYYQNQNTSNLYVPRDNEEDQNANRTQTEHKQNTNRTQTEPNNNDNNVNNDNKENKSIYSDVITYLNIQANKNYKSTTKKTKSLIQARVKEGFTLDEFKRVVDIKVKEWLNDEKMNMYLRPETLFGNRFEGYLNQKDAKVMTTVKPKDEYAYDMDKIRKQMQGRG